MNSLIRSFDYLSNFTMPSIRRFSVILIRLFSGTLTADLLCLRHFDVVDKLSSQLSYMGFDELYLLVGGAALGFYFSMS